MTGRTRGTRNPLESARRFLLLRRAALPSRRRRRVAQLGRRRPTSRIRRKSARIRNRWDRLTFKFSAADFPALVTTSKETFCPPTRWERPEIWTKTSGELSLG